MESSEQISLIARVSEVFSPAAPINRRDLFAGRFEQLRRVFDAVNTRGQHALIFGERGVGKTSLANIVSEVMMENRPPSKMTKVNCSKDDCFQSVWRKALEEIQLAVDLGRAEFGLNAAPKFSEFGANELLPDDPSPHDIRKAAMVLGKSMIIFDEFDRMGRQEAALFADTIKTLSDSSTDCTLVIVGVAQNIDELIAEHASIDRSLIQILMPRMDADELHEILNKAMQSLEMTMDSSARTLIVLLSQGLPHYAHVLGKASAIEALHAKRRDITTDDVHTSIEAAIKNTQQSIRSSYQQATASPRKDTLFKQVLLACALAEVDDLGFFASADVREPLSRIMGKPYDIPNFSQHLDKFSSADRGNVLEKAGTQRRFRFRFSNPLFQPFVIMRGIADGMLKQEDLIEILQRPPKMPLG
ncbi:MAG: AAA family ATPase [Planctomycetaceae bacterium]